MRVVLTGASGQLGAYLINELRARGHALVAWSGSTRGERDGVPLVPVDLANASAIKRALAQADPDAIVHAGAISSAEAVRRDPKTGRLVNVVATGRLAGWCERHARQVVYTSTDLVFDGAKGWYRESDPTEPVLAYGKTKLEAEAAILAVPRGLVARVSLLYGASRCGRPSFFTRTIQALEQRQPQRLFVHEFRTPLHYATAASLLVRLLEQGATGLLHVGGTERLSRFDLMRRAADVLGLDSALVQPGSQADVPMAEPRPRDVSLDTSRLALLLPDVPRPTVEDSLGRL